MQGEAGHCRLEGGEAGVGVHVIVVEVTILLVARDAGDNDGQRRGQTERHFISVLVGVPAASRPVPDQA